jgi:5-methylcytosine-specific restriction endonuclease McrA
MPLHPAWVKNISRRVLWAALEKDITKDERAAMSEYFEGQCAYCGDKLPKRWHADHIVSVDRGGFNHVSNRVPSCPRCNEQEKQEREWVEFLKSKCGSDIRTLDERKKRIEDWRDGQLPAIPPVTEAQRAAWKQEVNDLASAIDGAWNRLRRLKSG